MLWKRRGGIKPYGYDWNGDRRSPDYDPRRDPWLPGSPVYGQWPRYRWLRNAVREPMMWGLVAWFVVTFGLLGLYAVGSISHDTLFAGWVGKYLVLLAGLTLAGIWSAVAWVRRTPRGERGPALREKLKQAPRTIAWLTALTAVCIGLDILEKQHGVPFLVSGSATLAVWFSIVLWWRRPQGDA